MTVDEAFAIHNYLIKLEFPTVFNAATSFALFKTYGIPSISSLLVATGQLVNDTSASKRYADTGALLLEAILNRPTSDRAIAAIARINYLHDRHRKHGKITEPDLLYTLSLFALEPSTWVPRFEWRDLSDMELCAIGTLWKSLGEAFDIPYTLLPSSPSGWANGLDWLDELREWSRAYQEKNMVPAVSNKRLADSTFQILLWKLPGPLKGVGKNLVAALLEDQLREAMMIPPPPAGYTKFVTVAVTIRKFILRHLTLPRLRPKRVLPRSNPRSDRLFLLKYRMHPWYIEPTWKSRWGLSAWANWFRGATMPGDSKYYPEGFLSSEVGPIALMGKGHDEMEVTRERLVRANRGGCPFAAF